MRCTEKNSASSSCWSQGWANACHFTQSPQQQSLWFQEHDWSHSESNLHKSYEPTLYHVFMSIQLDLDSLWLSPLKWFRAIISLLYWLMSNPHSPSQNWTWERWVNLNHSNKRDVLIWREKQIRAHSQVKHKLLSDFSFYRQTLGRGNQGFFCLDTTYTLKLSNKKKTKLNWVLNKILCWMTAIVLYSGGQNFYYKPVS